MNGTAPSIGGGRTDTAFDFRAGGCSIGGMSEPNVEALARAIADGIEDYLARHPHAQYEGPHEAELAAFLSARGVLAPETVAARAMDAWGDALDRGE